MGESFGQRLVDGVAGISGAALGFIIGGPETAFGTVLTGWSVGTYLSHRRHINTAKMLSVGRAKKVSRKVIRGLRSKDYKLKKRRNKVF